MKKLKVLGLAAIAAGMFSFTSCLDSGGNTQQLSGFAVVDYSPTMRMLIYPLGYYPLYISTIANDPNYSAGDCVMANFTVDFDSDENANASANGFYVATGAASSPLAKYELMSSPSDSVALHNELLMSGSESGMLFSSNFQRILIVPTFASVLTDQKNTYTVSMDFSQEPEMVEGTDRVYTLCIRAQKLTDGKAPTLGNAKEPIAVEGRMFYSMLKSKEAAAGKKLVSYRVKYPLTFNADSTKIATWGYSPVSQFSIVEAAQ